MREAFTSKLSVAFRPSSVTSHEAFPSTCGVFSTCGVGSEAGRKPLGSLKRDFVALTSRHRKRSVSRFFVSPVSGRNPASNGKRSVSAPDGGTTK